MREKGTTLLGAQQYQQALTVYAFQQGQSIAIKYQLLLLPTVVLGEKVKKKNGAKDFGAFGWMSSITYIYPPPAFPLYIPGSFSQSTHRTVDTHIVIYCFSCCYLSPPLVYTHSYISLPPPSLLVRRAFSRMKLVYYHPCDCGRSATSHAGLPKNHIIVISI